MKEHILIKYEAHLPTITKKDYEWIECEPDLFLGSLLNEIQEKYQCSFGDNSLGNRFSLLVTLNGEFMPTSKFEETLLKDGDEVTLLPPVAGG
jgi:thiamine biosynthesis protein ThiS